MQVKVKAKKEWKTVWRPSKEETLLSKIFSYELNKKENKDKINDMLYNKIMYWWFENNIKYWMWVASIKK